MKTIIKTKQEIDQLINEGVIMRKADAISKCQTDEQRELVNNLQTIEEDKEFDKKQFEQNTGEMVPMITFPLAIHKKYVRVEDIEKILEEETND